MHFGYPALRMQFVVSTDTAKFQLVALATHLAKMHRPHYQPSRIQFGLLEAQRDMKENMKRRQGTWICCRVGQVLLRSCGRRHAPWADPCASARAGDKQCLRAHIAMEEEAGAPQSVQPLCCILCNLHACRPVFTTWQKVLQPLTSMGLYDFPLGCCMLEARPCCTGAGICIQVPGLLLAASWIYISLICCQDISQRSNRSDPLMAKSKRHRAYVCCT